MNVRSLYMNGHLSHDDYYGFLAEIIKPPIPLIERVRKSTDPHLNDIPLKRWDAGHAMIRSRAMATGVAYFTLNTAKPVMAWSLSDSVCTAKAYARRLVETEPA